MARVVIRRLRSWPRKWRVLLTVVMTVGVSVMLIRTLLAVHDLAFELEGDITTDGSSIYPAFHSGTVDWQSFFGPSTQALPFGGNALPLPINTAPAGGTFTASGFVRDFKTNSVTRRGVTTVTFDTSDDSTYTTGSKDILGINGSGSNHWQCTPANNVTDKGDIMNSYVAAYTGPGANGQQFLYFALERSANTGDANVAFWFLQDKVACDGSSGTATFTGHHTDGDVLVVSAFTNGGGVSGINAYRWTCQSNGVPLTGVACDDAPNNPVAVPLASGSDCRISTTPAGDNICASVNTDGTQTGLPNVNGVGGTIDVPWLTFAKTLGIGHKLPTSQFFEGGINLTNTGLGGHCFNDFLSDTRSSQSLTASLYDFANGGLGECGSSTTTASSNITGTTYVPIDPATSSTAVTDTATVTVTGIPSFDGSVTFHLCGPTVSTGTNFTCGTGGVLIGTKSTPQGGQSTASPWIVSSSGLTANVTAAGRYCWRAEFTSTTSGVPPSDDTLQSDAATKECFVITPQTASISTTATTGPVDFGQKISDTVTIGNTAHEPGSGGSTDSTTINGFAATINATADGAKAGGTIQVEAYGPDSCTTKAFTSQVITLGSGTIPRVTNSTSYGGAGSAFEFTPSAPGVYVFVAVYSGDLPNTLGNGALGSTACGTAPDSEKVTVRTIPTSIATTPRAYPNDSATITSSVGNLAAGGTIVFRLFQSTNGATALVNCNANGATGLLYTQTFTNQPSSAQSSVTASTTNYPSNAGAVAVSAADTVYWRVTYAPGDTAHTGIQSACVENNGLTFTAEAGPGTKFP